MLRLPHFSYRAPTTVQQAVDMLAAAQGSAVLVGGGTDLLPNMKRRQQTPAVLIGLRRVAELKQTAWGGGLTLGAGLTITELLQLPGLRRRYRGLWEAASQIATPHLRNMGTLGGNLCLDTRCNYYNQSYEWRQSIDFCMKKDGGTCWVATSSPRCLAVSSSDMAPMLVALGASIALAGPDGTRRLRLADFYRNDGINYLTRGLGEIVTAIELPHSTAGAAHM